MPSAAVIVCAHNEERLIGDLLRDVLTQQLSDGFPLREVLVVADGCTDRTADIVRGVAAADARVRLMELPVPNRGKSRAFNAGIATLDDEVVILADADIRLAHDGVLARLVRAAGEGAVLVSGNDVPDPAPVRTWGHAAALGRHLIKQELKVRVAPRPNVYSCVGRLLAMHHTFYAGLEIPDVPGEDNFRYFTAVARGMPYAYAHDAVVFFRPALTVRDYIRQHARFWHGVGAFRAAFGDRAQYGTVRDWCGAVLTVAARHPGVMAAWAGAALAGQAVYWWQRYVARTPQTGAWESASSTK